MPKIEVRNPVVVLDGDETARGIWNAIRDRLIVPYVDVDLRYRELGIESRAATGGTNAVDVARAIADCRVAVKSPSIVPNATIRERLRATAFRETIVCANLTRLVDEGPVPILAQYAHGDGDDAGESLRDFARACCNYGLYRGYPVYLSTRRTVAKSSFEETYDQDFRAKFIGAGLAFECRSIDDLAAVARKANGKIVWGAEDGADGRGFGSRGITSSILMTPDGMTLVAEAGDGEAATNANASIFAWTRGLAHRGRLDRSYDLVWFAQTLERVCIELVEAGQMTGDLADLVGPGHPRLSMDEYLAAVDRELGRRISLVESATP